MPVRFDMSGLKGVMRKVEEMTTPAMRLEVSQVLAATALKETMDGFRQSRDPYGNPWAPLRSRKGKPLLKTGRMRASTHPIRVGPDGFGIQISAVYAIVHQTGGHVAPHSRIRGFESYQDPKTGRYLRKTTKRKLVYVTRVSRQTFGNGITIPQRMMVPETDKGLGSIWGAAFTKAATRVVQRRLHA